MNTKLIARYIAEDWITRLGDSEETREVLIEALKLGYQLGKERGHSEMLDTLWISPN